MRAFGGCRSMCRRTDGQISLHCLVDRGHSEHPIHEFITADLPGIITDGIGAGSETVDTQRIFLACGGQIHVGPALTGSHKRQGTVAEQAKSNPIGLLSLFFFSRLFCV